MHESKRGLLRDFSTCVESLTSTRSAPLDWTLSAARLCVAAISDMVSALGQTCTVLSVIEGFALANGVPEREAFVRDALALLTAVATGDASLVDLLLQDDSLAVPGVRVALGSIAVAAVESVELVTGMPANLTFCKLVAELAQ